ncbi:Aste57867_7727 [Aphanomyces stellatus]|nr:hypothetical protein As57867_007698 [Aphanomyces stellatus]VFT84628.1 Aste57867_7727 [Aphanomyces stellatus]
MALHSSFDPTKESIYDVQNRLAPLFKVIPPLAEDRTLWRLDQIFAGEYAAGYYSYTWSEVLSSDAYAALEEAATEDEWKATGRKYRDTMLALVGIYDPNQVFEMFRGRKPSPDALLRLKGLK